MRILLLGNADAGQSTLARWRIVRGIDLEEIRFYDES